MYEKLYYLQVIDRTCNINILIKDFYFFKYTKKIYPIYNYWIEYRFDEDRFYYCEEKPIRISEKDNLFKMQYNSIHTKNGLIGSLSIAEKIKERIVNIYNDNPEILLKEYYNPDYMEFNIFSKENNQSKNNKKSELKGIFL